MESELRNDFNYFDKDRDGIISHSDMRTTIRLLGHTISDEEVTEIFSQVGTKHNGKMNFEEFVFMMKRFSDPRTKEEMDTLESEIQDAFHSFDQDDDGAISRSDLRMKLNGKILEDEIEELFEEADTNRDGVIDYQEFKQAFFVWI